MLALRRRFHTSFSLETLSLAVRDLCAGFCHLTCGFVLVLLSNGENVGLRSFSGSFYCHFRILEDPVAGCVLNVYARDIGREAHSQAQVSAFRNQ